MIKQLMFFTAVAMLPALPLAAEEMKSEVSHERRAVEVDSQSGTLREQTKIQQESVKKEVESEKTRIDRAHTERSTISSENVQGDQETEDTHDSTKTSVTTRPDGIQIEQKKQHSERVLTE